MARKKGFKIPGVSFSARRALGITKAKRRLSRKIGIPLSKAGMQRKVGKAVMGGGCILPVLSLLLFLALLVFIVF
jgi:hypothetical protein